MLAQKQLMLRAHLKPHPSILEFSIVLENLVASCSDRDAQVTVFTPRSADRFIAFITFAVGRL